MALFIYCNGLVGRVRPATCETRRSTCPRNQPARKRGGGSSRAWRSVLKF
jgi:hypothetical protein